MLDFSTKKATPKSKSTFKTSTPKKATAEKETTQKSNMNESNFGNSTSISQLHGMNTSTFNRPQMTTCSDRLGTPKTSLNDFKKLLLNATNRKLMAKPSAVEQLKLKQESLSSSPMKILDLTSSPKSFTNRRVLHQPQTPSLSPYKKSNLMSPRSRWKYNTFNKSSIASIPEVNIEDDASSTGSNHNEDNVRENLLENMPIYSTPQKKLNQIENSTSYQTPIAQTESLVPIDVETESSPETGIIETNFSMKENLFLLSEENNFMPGEIRPYGASLAKKTILKPIAELPTKPDIVATSTPTPAPTLETSF